MQKIEIVKTKILIKQSETNQSSLLAFHYMKQIAQE